MSWLLQHFPGLAIVVFAVDFEERRGEFPRRGVGFDRLRDGQWWDVALNFTIPLGGRTKRGGGCRGPEIFRGVWLGNFAVDAVGFGSGDSQLIAALGSCVWWCSAATRRSAVGRGASNTDRLRSPHPRQAR